MWHSIPVTQAMVWHSFNFNPELLSSALPVLKRKREYEQTTHKQRRRWMIGRRVKGNKWEIKTNVIKKKGWHRGAQAVGPAKILRVRPRTEEPHKLQHFKTHGWMDGWIDI